MEPEGSSLCSQDPVTGSFPESIHILQSYSYLIKAHFDTILPCTLSFLMSLLCKFHLAHASCLPRPSHLPLFDNPNNIWRRVQIMKLIVIRFSPASGCSRHLRPKLEQILKSNLILFALMLLRKWRINSHFLNLFDWRQLSIIFINNVFHLSWVNKREHIPTSVISFLYLAEKQRLPEDGTFPPDIELNDGLWNRKEISAETEWSVNIHIPRSPFIKNELFFKDISEWRFKDINISSKRHIHYAGLYSFNDLSFQACVRKLSLRSIISHPLF
jgi:hypothetical protein